MLVEVHYGLVTLGETGSIEDTEGYLDLVLTGSEIRWIRLELSVKDLSSSEAHLSEVLVDVNSCGFGFTLETVKLGLEQGALDDL